ncbi:MAG: hypothetical protein JWP89_349 [Schlesneria sp.]|nr:hypothetical protein [Schlesneria sp.]
MSSDSFEEIIQRYKSDGVVFRSQNRVREAYYAVASVDDSGFVVDRLSADEPVRCPFDSLVDKRKLVQQNGGHLPLTEFDGTTAVRMAYLQASEFGVSVDRKEILDLSDDDYALAHFKQLITSLNVSKASDAVRLCKPVIIWCVLNGVKSGDLESNSISFEWLVPHFLNKTKELGIGAGHQQAAEAFFHLTGESFWLLAYHDTKQYFHDTPSPALVQDRVKYACLKDTFWRLLSKPEDVASLLDLVASHWLSKASPKAGPMNINVQVLDAAVEKTIRPFLIDQGKLKDPKFEGYLQATVLPKVRPVLQKEVVDADPVQSLKAALDANIKLLSPFERQWALDFAKSVDPEELRKHLLDLLCGISSLEDRIRTFFEWSKIRENEGGKKSGIQLTVIGYLLGLSNPDKYAFCKPNVFAAAAAALLPAASQQLGGVERLAFASNFYQAALDLFRGRYKLPFKNLLDVHSAFYIMSNPYHKLPGWDELKNGATSKTTLSRDLNVILYGPPGTGKTYDSVRHAVEICDGHAPSDRSEMMSRYQQLRHENRIGFVTFHQSYGYEDFVEGIRPVLGDSTLTDSVESKAESRIAATSVRYECRPGILKRMCSLARSKSIKQLEHLEIDFEKATIWKMSLGDTQNPDQIAIYDECIENNYVLLGYGRGLNFEDCANRKEIIAKLQAYDPTILPTDFDVVSINAFQQEIAVGDLIVISDGNHKFRAIARVSGPYRFLERPSYQQMRPVQWLAVFDESLPHDTIQEKKFSQMCLYRLRKKDLNLSALKERIASKPEEPRNHVLIIDEINRGNVSKILGELITLLEPDKRLGAENELTVTLPYSEDKNFGVPSNLYLVGTMNTADRSIAFLDVALRRRFKFIEMMPDCNLIRTLSDTDGDVDGIDVPRILATINDRIEILYDRDHQIGHSFFLGIKSLAQLRDVFTGKVIPLLQEYFYGDWTKICFVLGCPFDEAGKSIGKNSTPIIQTRLLSVGNFAGAGVDLVDDKVRCDVHPLFLLGSNTEELGPFFDGVIGSMKAQ